MVAAASDKHVVLGVSGRGQDGTAYLITLVNADVLELRPSGWYDPPPEATLPTQPWGSCWLSHPTGCPCSAGSACRAAGRPAYYPSPGWNRDTFGENNYNARRYAGCMARAVSENEWCGTTDVAAYYVPIPRRTMLFGSSVAMSEQHVLVGAEAERHEGKTVQPNGAAYLYRLNNLSAPLRLIANDSTADALFGSTVALHGEHAFVGARGDNGRNGSVYIFDVTTGSELAKLVLERRDLRVGERSLPVERG